MTNPSRSLFSRFLATWVAALLSVLMASAAIAAPLNGAIWTTLQNGDQVDANLFDSKDHVYLNGGPRKGQGQLPDGFFYFMVTDPSGAVLLSMDSVDCRRIQVVNGIVAGSVPSVSTPDCSHPNGLVSSKGLPVKLMPFADSPNGGGEYKVWITPISEYNVNGANDPKQKWGFSGATKTDNFKVIVQPAYVVACKFNDLDGLGTLDAGEPVISGWPITASGVNGGTVTLQTDANGCVSFTVSNPGSGTITVTEGTLGDSWVQTSPTPGPHARAGNSPAYTVDYSSGTGVVSTNDLQPGDIFTIDFGNTNPACSAEHPCNPPNCLTNPTPDCVGLFVTKTANPSYRMTWSLQKDADSATVYTDATGKATAGYTVTVHHGDGTDFTVSGDITVSNETVMDAFGVTVTDLLGGGWACTVQNGENITVAAGSSVKLPYTCVNGSLAAPPTEPLTNSATATWSGNFATGSAPPISFSSATVIDDVVNITDPMAPGDHVVDFRSGNDIKIQYSAQLQGSAGTCIDVPNTATLTTQTVNSLMVPLTDDATVKVCSANTPVVTKTANPTFKRTYNWKIEKSVDATQKNVSSGNATFNYTVKVTQLASTDSDWKVTGAITVTNSNDFESIDVNVTDQLPNANCTVDTPTLTVPARVGETNGSASTNYSCTYTSAPGASPVNTGTATWTAATAHTATGTASGTANVVFGAPTTTVNKVITVKDAFNGGAATLLDDGAGNSTATASDDTPTVKTFTYSHDVPGTAGTCVSYPNTASFKSNDSDLAGTADVTVKVCQGADLSVSKTATPAFKRSYTWNITKGVDNTSLKTSGADVTFNYTVVATQTGQQDSDWQVTGTITVTNPNDWQDVSVTLSDAIGSTGVCTVNGTATATISVPKKVGATNGTATASYTCTYATQPASEFTNTVTASWSGASTPGTSATGTATGNFLTPTATLHKTINVSDIFNGGAPDSLFQVVATDPPAAPASGSKNYSHTVNTAAGTCTTYPNIASFASTDTPPATGSANKSVEVCRGANLTVSKTVSTTYARTYNWTLAKSVDKTHVEITDPNSTTFNYVVTATQTGFSDSNIGASGTITVVNPNTWQDVSVNLADAIQGGPACTITEGATQNVPKNGSVTVHYTCAPSSATNFVNEVTASWNAAAAFTPDSSATNTANGTFGAPASTTNATITVKDNWNGEGVLTLGTVNAVDTGLPKSTDFPYAKTVSGVPGKCTTYTNNATLTGDTASGSASKTVEVCVGIDLQVSKTADPSFQRMYTWTLDKSVDSTLFVAGGTANYTVVVTQTGAQDGNWMVLGNITVTNPNEWQAVTFNLSDAINNGGVCTISGGGSNIVLAAGQTVTKAYNCTYSAPPSAAAFVNTATAAVTAGLVPTSSKSGTASGQFTTPTGIVNETVTITDTMKGMLGTVTGTNSAPFATQTFTYSRFIAAPSSGCAIVNNTATIIETGASDTVQVSACAIFGHTMGFWHNKNGQKIIDSGDQAALSAFLHQFNAFADAPNGSTPGAIGDWVSDVIDAASCAGPTCNKMLRAQMLSTALAVFFWQEIGDPVDIGTATISLTNPENVKAAFGGATSMTILNMLLFQNGVSTANGATWYGQNKTLQVLAKDAFDNINNGKIAGP